MGRKNTVTYQGGLSAAVTGVQYLAGLGWHSTCSLTRFGDAQGTPPTFIVGETWPTAGPDFYGRYQWALVLQGPAGSSVAVTCHTAL